MKFFREMDLYKALILVCLLAMPVCGWWCYTLDQSIVACQKAVREAKRSGGLLEEIGALQTKVDLVVQNRLSTNDATRQPVMYFENQLTAASLNLKNVDFTPTEPKEEAAATGSRRTKAVDFVCEILWKRKDLPLPLEFIYAALFNCESGAKQGGDHRNLQSIWKLRELHIQNATNDKLLNLGSNPEAPPLELKDLWAIKKMTFARREPRA